MKIRYFDIERIAFYPTFFNPLIWIQFALFILKMIFVSWWRVDCDYEGEIKYFVFKFDSYKWREFKADLFLLVFGSIINSFWWNRKRTKAYTDYIEEKYFSKYKDDDWLKGYYLETKYSYYLDAKVKKNRF